MLEWQQQSEHSWITTCGRYSIAITMRDSTPHHTVWRLTPDTAWFCPVGPPHVTLERAKSYAQADVQRRVA